MGPEHLNVATSLHNLAVVLRGQVKSSFERQQLTVSLEAS